VAPLGAVAALAVAVVAVVADLMVAEFAEQPITLFPGEIY
jgi:hypothetical protein